MATLDTVTLKNPTSEDFSWNFNNETYYLAANESKSFVESVGMHIAKHLACKIVAESFPAKIAKEKPLVVSQSLNYDNPKLRIELYKILGDKNLVNKTIASYPFKDVVGDMREYEDFVAKEENKTKEPVKSKKKEE